MKAAARSLFVCALSLAGAVLMPAPAHASGIAPRVALVVGNTDYRGTDRLVSPSPDAELIAQSLRRIGFTVDLEENRTRAQMLGDLDTFSRAAAHASIALLYYAGHGFEMGGENYLIPVDMPVPIGQVSEGDLMRFAVPLRYVQSTASRGEPRALVMLLDACRSAAVRGGTTPSMAPVVAAHGTLIAFATQPGGAALDSFSVGSIRHQHSPFAWYLSQAIAGGGDVVAALGKTQVDVAAATGDAQRPWFNNGLVGNLKLSDSMAPGPDANVRQPALAAGGSRGAGPASITPETSSAETVPPDDSVQTADEQALARQWAAQTLRMHALFLQMTVNPQIADQVRQAARTGDLFSMTTLALSLFVVPDGMPQEEARARVAEGTMYLNAASDRDYPMAQALRAGWIFAHARLPSDIDLATHYFRAAVDHGYAESLPNLIGILTVTGDGNLPMYLAKYRRIYGHDFDYSTIKR
ncbi:caspase family protein [Paraburkholderia ferrariae]|uniref:caspase family protein n=1 Tax=Paraburkholderia ferrariae TaxID=386056 RepID=UPI000480CA09|nr:caspase family protein [Paraburkholderia ferrariae]